MIKEKIINKNDNNSVEQIKKIYMNSFPKNEREDFNNFFGEGKFLYAYFLDEEVIAFIECYKKGDLSFIMYFAVKDKFRGKGYGSKVLDIFKKHSTTIALNIESFKYNANNTMQRFLRTQFYAKNGFKMSDVEFEWEGEILCTMYYGMLNYDEYKKHLLAVFPTCKDFRKLESSMLTSMPININMVDYFYKYFTLDFPYNERRAKFEIKNLIRNNKRFNLRYVVYNFEIVGYIIFWNCEDFIFIENFAIMKKMRDQGFGTEFLKSFIKVYQNIVFEVEFPNTLVQKRRINFYKKLGFEFVDVQYTQPSYHHKGKNGPDLKLMKSKNQVINMEKSIKKIKKIVYDV